ncbi:molecular chaperone DnaJ [Fictibacillus sp. NRS-1165]|uniref:molecular chaperone DnaJ n=1 Tax=Fictibacillus sp. NRS-1165 TaxID=3144463 RepID=UPI003D2453C9
MRYFKNIETLEELKKAYRKLCKVHHPDAGGKHEDFVAMRAEYERILEGFKSGRKASGASAQEMDQFADIIDGLMKFDLTIEIVGTWVWVTGDTKPVKEELKSLGFKWANKKKAWYWHEGEYKRKGKKEYTMDDIRNMHGSAVVRYDKPERKAIGA